MNPFEGKAFKNQFLPGSPERVATDKLLLFRKLLAAYRKHRTEKRQLKNQLRYAMAQIDMERRAKSALEARLRRVVKADVATSYDHRDLVIMSIQVDRRMADLSTTNVWEEATRQLINHLQNELHKH